MTINDAGMLGVKRIRLPDWNYLAYLELYIVPGGFYGPWARLHDAGVPPDGISIAVCQLGDDDSWEPYAPPEPTHEH